MPLLQSLVLVDADEPSRAALAAGFLRQGKTLREAQDLEEGLALVATRRPDLVVVSSGPDGVDPVLSVQALRASAGRELPILVLGERTARAAVLAAGADEDVSWPAAFRDLLTLCRLTVEAKAGGGEVEGQLGDYGLYALARAIAAAKSSAVLFLERERRSGDLRFRDGELIAARVGQQTGANAFLHLLLWDAAGLHLRFGDPNTACKIHKPTERLLEDGLRFVAEFESIAEKVGGTLAVYRHDRARIDEVRREVPSEVLPFVESYDGRRTLIDVVEDSPFKPFDTIMITYRLAEMKAIVRADEPAAPGRLAARSFLLESEARRPGGNEGGGAAATAAAGPRGDAGKGQPAASGPVPVAVPPATSEARGASGRVMVTRETSGRARDTSRQGRGGRGGGRPGQESGRPGRESGRQGRDGGGAPRSDLSAGAGDSSSRRDGAPPRDGTAPPVRGDSSPPRSDATARAARSAAQGSPQGSASMARGDAAARDAPSQALQDAVTARKDVAPRGASSPVPRPAPSDASTRRLSAPTPQGDGASTRHGTAGRGDGAPLRDPSSPVAHGASAHGGSPRHPGDGSAGHRAAFDALDEEFFAREAELFRVSEAESFEDLDPLASAPPQRRSWFSFGGGRSASRPPVASSRKPAKK